MSTALLPHGPGQTRSAAELQAIAEDAAPANAAPPTDATTPDASPRG